MPTRLKPDLYQLLHNRLTQLFPGDGSGTSPATIAKLGELDTAAINFNGDGITVWDRILSHAEQEEKIAHLLEVIRGRYPNDPLIQELITGIGNGAVLITAPAIQYASSGVVKQGGSVKVFINYHQEVESYKEKIVDYLTTYLTLPDPFPATLFDMHKDVLVTDNRMEKLKEELVTSDLVLLLLSNGFLVRDKGICYDPLTLMALALKKKIAPILVTPAPVERIKIISGLKMLPRNDEPLSAQADLDSAVNNIAQELFDVIQKISK